jgi:hypothetical protein
MSVMRYGQIGLPLMFTLLLAAGEIRAATLYVANNGVDSGTCGAQTEPCRSITQTIANTSAGDTVIVGPGKYGDLDGDPYSFLPGEDRDVLIDKALTIESSHGAQETFLHSGGHERVDLMVSGTTFGRPGHGFTLMVAYPYQNNVYFSPSTNGSSVGGNILTEYRIVMHGSGHTLVQNYLVCQNICGLIHISGTGHSLIEKKVCHH